MKTKNTILILLALVLSSVMVDAQNSGGFAPEGLYLDKKVIEDPSKPNSYEIQLETFVTGVKSVGQNPVDVMFILDVSESMKNDNKLNALKTATKSFLDVLSPNKNAKASIIIFSADAELKTEPSFVPIKDNINQLKSLVDGLGVIAHTRIDKGAQLGLSTFQNLTNSTDIPKYCIILTDGEPGTTLHPDYDVAQDTWQATYQMKQMGITVYTVFLGTEGINKQLENASDGCTMNTRNFLDGTSSNFPTAYWNLYTGTNWTNLQDYWVEYRAKGKPSAMKYGTKANRADTKYFLEVANPTALATVFEDLASDISEAVIALGGETTTIVDVVTESFKIPDEFKLSGGAMDPSCVTVYAKECTNMRSLDNEGTYEYLFEGDPIYKTGDNLLKDVVVSTPNSQEVRVSGFDFSTYYVMGDPEKHEYQGYKLVITFPIVINPDNPGGATTATNTAESGVYFDSDGDGVVDTQIGGFAIPSVKIPNIVVMKEGLHKGESAIFNVYRIDNNNGVVTRSIFPTVLVVTQKDDSGVAFARMKIQKPGRYEIKETSWSWAYDVTGYQADYNGPDDNSSITPDQWHENGFGTPEEVAAQKYLATIPFAFGTSIDSDNHSITRNINDFTEDVKYGYKGTFFIFKNADKSGTPAHAEANKNNEFYECE